MSEASTTYFETYRRYNYTTPKSYLELISLYKMLLARKRQELRAARERLENGVDKIAQASAQVRGWRVLLVSHVTHKYMAITRLHKPLLSGEGGGRWMSYMQRPLCALHGGCIEVTIAHASCNAVSICLLSQPSAHSIITICLTAYSCYNLLYFPTPTSCAPSCWCPENAALTCQLLLHCTHPQVADLQLALKEEQIIVEEKKAQTDELIVSIGKEKGIVDEAVEAGREDEEAASRLQAEVMAFQEECARDLSAAEPIIKEAEAALNSLDKGSLGELKSFGSPAAEIVQVGGGSVLVFCCDHNRSLHLPDPNTGQDNWAAYLCHISHLSVQMPA